MIQRPSRSIWARRAGVPPPLIVDQPGPTRRDHRRVDICPPIASQPFARSSASNRANSRSAGSRQLLAVQPDRLGVGDGVVQCQPDKPREGQTVSQLILGLVI
jgi:hypothetical protein